MSEGGFVGGRGIAGPGDELLGDDEKVHGGLGPNVVNDDAALILMLDPGGNFPVDDALEDGLHGIILQEDAEEAEVSLSAPGRIIREMPAVSLASLKLMSNPIGTSSNLM